MRRREFMALAGGAAVTWPAMLRAQQAERVRRIGVLLALPEDNLEAKAWLAAFRNGLQRRGWQEGRNLRIDFRFAAGQRERVPGLAKELIALEPDAVIAHTTAVAAVLQRESRAVPIVFVHVSDPIGAGLVASLSRAGGNITGVLHYEAGIVGKWLAMLKEIAPRVARAALLANRRRPRSTISSARRRPPHRRSASSWWPARSRPPPTSSARSKRSRAADSGLVLPPDATTILRRDVVVAAAARHRMPVVCPMQVFVSAGGLISYGTDQDSLFRLAASYVDRFLRGVAPADSRCRHRPVLKPRSTSRPPGPSASPCRPPCWCRRTK